MALPEIIPRRNIDDAFARFMPAQTQAKPSKEVVEAGVPLQKRVSARLENVTDGICPYCKSKMQLSNAAGLQVFVCGHDRAISPVPNGFDSTASVLAGL